VYIDLTEDREEASRRIESYFPVDAYRFEPQKVRIIYKAAAVDDPRVFSRRRPHAQIVQIV
jgi:hypothetical protein